MINEIIFAILHCVGSITILTLLSLGVNTIYNKFKSTN